MCLLTKVRKEMSNTIILEWQKLRSIKELENDSDNLKPGVYFWGFKLDNGEFLPYYIGKSIRGTIRKRLAEHVIGIMGGSYSIYHENSLHDFYKYKYSGNKKSYSGNSDVGPNINADKGLLSQLDTDQQGISILLDGNNRSKLLKHIYNMVDRFHYSYATVEIEPQTSKILNCIEKWCLEHYIGKEGFKGIKSLCNTKTGSAGKDKDLYIKIEKEIVNKDKGKDKISILFENGYK